MIDLKRLVHWRVFVLLILCILTSFSANVVGGGLIVTSDTSISTVLTYDSVIVNAGKTLTINDTVTVIGEMRVFGKLTHSPRLLIGLQLRVHDSLRIESTGSINLDAVGLSGGTSATVNGEAFDSLGNIVNSVGSAVTWAAGASYGGRGANSQSYTNIPYGSVENPDWLGAGGGGATLTQGPRGGGRASIVAKYLVVNGTVSANGGPGRYFNGICGAGSGGSIKIAATSLAGSGAIQALGGAGLYVGASASGSGGGGRISISYSSMTFPLANITAYGGEAGFTGSAGSIFLRDSAASFGDLIYDNGTISPQLSSSIVSDRDTIRALTLKNYSKVRCDNFLDHRLVLQQPAVLSTNSSLYVDSGFTFSSVNLTGADVVVNGTTQATFANGAVVSLRAIQVNGGSLIIADSLSIPSSSGLELHSHGMVTLQAPGQLSLTRVDSSSLTSGKINLPFGTSLSLGTDTLLVPPGVQLGWTGGTVRVPSQLNAIIVRDTLTIDSPVTITGDLVVESGGVVNHTLRNLRGLQLSVSGQVWVQIGGAMDVSARGLLGAYNSGNGAWPQAYDSSGTLTTFQNSTFVGGSHGGAGRNGSATWVYEQAESPSLLGSGGGPGGGQNGCCGSPGGNGGGFIQLQATSVVVDGKLGAEGQAGDWALPGALTCGGGAGGSIDISADSISGSGVVSAAGGYGAAPFFGSGAAGGGGRIAVKCNSLTMITDSIQAPGGGGVAGAAGTIFVRLSRSNSSVAGKITVDNRSRMSASSTPLKTGLSPIQTLELKPGAVVTIDHGRVPEPFQVLDPILLSGKVSLATSGALTLQISNSVGFDFQVDNGATAVFGSGMVPVFDRIRVTGDSSRLSSQVDLNFSSPNGFELSGTSASVFTTSASFSIPSFDGTNIISGQFKVLPTGKLVVGSDSIVIAPSVTLTKDGAFGASGDHLNRLTVNGTLTHSQGLLTGLQLNISNRLMVPTGGKIDVSGKGLRGGYNSGNGPWPEAYDSTGTLTTLFANSSHVGGSHGGIGAGSLASWVYEQNEDPSLLGSGGGPGGGINGCCANQGGNGGGIITVNSPLGTLRVDGSLLADGQDGTWQGFVNAGGGSGGSINITADSISGTGLVRAKGGDGGGPTNPSSGGQSGGTGGGGRIGLQFNYLGLLPDSLNAQAGVGPRTGSAGTVFLRSSASDVSKIGDLIISNRGNSTQLLTPVSSNNPRYGKLIIKDGGSLDVRREVEVDTSLVVSNGRIGRP